MMPVSENTTPSKFASDSTLHVEPALEASALDGSRVAVAVDHRGVDRRISTSQFEPVATEVHELGRRAR